VFGSGGSSTWFRQTREGATNPNEFFAALDAVKVDGGDNRFVGTYQASKEFMESHGWEARTMYWPPRDDYTETPKASGGWLSRTGWLSGGLEALNAKVPPFRPGYYIDRPFQGTKEIVLVESEDSHQLAILDGQEIVYFADMGDGVHRLPYRWGDQAAAAYILIKDGKKADYIQGCGDGTPIIVESDEKCMADGKLYSSDKRTERMARQEEEDTAFLEAADRLGVTDEYLRLVNDISDSSDESQAAAGKLARQIDEEVVRFAANARAEADKTGILKRLLKHLRARQNPLKSLRREKGGVWAFHREWPTNLPSSAVIYHGDNWWVTWTK